MPQAFLDSIMASGYGVRKHRGWSRSREVQKVWLKKFYQVLVPLGRHGIKRNWHKVSGLKITCQNPEKAVFGNATFKYGTLTKTCRIRPRKIDSRKSATFKKAECAMWVYISFQEYFKWNAVLMLTIFKHFLRREIGLLLLPS